MVTNDSEDVVLAHDQVVLTVDLDLGGPVFGDEDFVADFDVEFDLLAIVVELASADGNDGTFLRLLFRRVGNDDASLLDFLLFERLNQHAIAERFHIDCHMFCILLDQDPNAVSDGTLECFVRGNTLLWPTGAPSLIIRSMPLATSWATRRTMTQPTLSSNVRSNTSSITVIILITKLWRSVALRSDPVQWSHNAASSKIVLSAPASSGLGLACATSWLSTL